MVGIVLFGTDDTKNHLAKNDQYQNITGTYIKNK